MFYVSTINPHVSLGHCVDSYQLISVDEADGGFIQNTLLPHVTQSLVFGLDGANTVYDCLHSEFCALHFITGPNDALCHIKFFAGMKKLVINFKPGGLFKIFHLPSYYFINRTRDAREFIGQSVSTIGKQLRESSAAANIDLVNNWLISQLQIQKKPDRNIDEALRLIERNKGNISIRQLELSTYTTKRTLERHFLEQVGMHPKTYSRIVRFSGVIRYMESNFQVKWRQLAETFGYYDQSHFIHDFKTLTGSLPQHYFSLKSRSENILQG